MKTGRNYKLTMIITLTVILISAVTGCGGLELQAPGGLVATAADVDNPNRIEISWLPVTGADIYYVYRDAAEGGSFAVNAGFSVTSSVDDSGVTRFYFMETFEEGEGGTYYYKVTAAENADISLESAKSAAVSVSTYSGSWSAADPAILGAAEQLSLSATTNTLYVIYGTTAMSAKKYAIDADSEADPQPKIWTALGGTPGTTSAAVNSPPAFASLISGGELYLSYADSGTTPAGKASMKYYHDSGTQDAPSFSWTAAGAAGFNAAAATNISLSTAGGFSQDIYATFLDGTDIQLYKYNSTTVSWFDINLTTSLLPNVSTVSLLSHSNNLYLGYEDTDATGLYLRSYDDGVTALQAGGQVSAAAVDDGNAVFVSGGGDLYAVYITVGGGLSVKKLVDSSWTALADVAGDSPPVATDASLSGTLAAHWYNGFLYVFYADSSDGGKGWVKYYSETDGWQNAERGGAALTGATALGSFQLASSGTELYGGYIEDGKAYIRILK